MKTTWLYLASIFLLSGCYNLSVDLPEAQIQRWVTPKNVVLAVTSAYLNRRPDADVTLLMAADNIRDLVEEDRMAYEDAFARVVDELKERKMKRANEVVFILDGIFEKYAYIFDQNLTDTIEYRDVLEQIADGIEASLVIVQTEEMQKLEKKQNGSKL